MLSLWYRGSGRLAQALGPEGTWFMYRIVLSVALMIIFYALPRNCGATDERISFGQLSSGEAFAAIDGNFVYCDINGGFLGNPALSIADSDVEITSTVRWGDCPGPSPSTPPPVPYQLTQDLGTLSNGQYMVTWTYMTDFPVMALLTMQGRLWVEGGEAAIFHGSFE